MNSYALWLRRSLRLTFTLGLLWAAVKVNAQNLPGIPGNPGPIDTVTGPPGTDTGCAGMTASCTTLDASSCDPCNGWVIIDVSGGTPPYSGWKVPTSIDNNIPPGAGGNQFVKTNLCPGTHKFVILDSSHPRCKVEKTITIGGCNTADTTADTMVVEISGKWQVPTTYLEGKAYPNPFTDHTYIGYESRDGGNASLVLYNEMGSVVRQTTITLKKGYNMLPVNGVGLAQGMYYVRINTPGQVTITRILRR